MILGIFLRSKPCIQTVLHILSTYLPILRRSIVRDEEKCRCHNYKVNKLHLFIKLTMKIKITKINNDKLRAHWSVAAAQ